MFKKPKVDQPMSEFWQILLNAEYNYIENFKICVFWEHTYLNTSRLYIQIRNIKDWTITKKNSSKNQLQIKQVLEEYYKFSSLKDTAPAPQLNFNSYHWISHYSFNQVIQQQFTE